MDGDPDHITVNIGEDGRPLAIKKLWRSLTVLGHASIISVSDVIDQLESEDINDQNELLMYPGTEKPLDIDINTIVLRYFETKGNRTYVEPVWVCIGSIRNHPNPRYNGQIIKFILNARHFANYTTTPSTTGVYEPIVFNDSSQTNASRWYWDFGDGTNSTLQNPLHIYDNAGTYTVNITVWNRFGKDTVSENVVVKGNSGSPHDTAPR